MPTGPRRPRAPRRRRNWLARRTRCWRLPPATVTSIGPEVELDRQRHHPSRPRLRFGTTRTRHRAWSLETCARQGLTGRQAPRPDGLRVVVVEPQSSRPSHRSHGDGQVVSPSSDVTGGADTSAAEVVAGQARRGGCCCRRCLMNPSRVVIANHGGDGAGRGAATGRPESPLHVLDIEGGRIHEPEQHGSTPVSGSPQPMSQSSMMLPPWLSAGRSS